MNFEVLYIYKLHRRNSGKKGETMNNDESEYSSSGSSSSLDIDAILYENGTDNDGYIGGDARKSLQSSRVVNGGNDTVTTNTGTGETGEAEGSNIRKRGGKKKRGSLYEEGNQIQKLEALRWLDVFVTLGGKRLKSLYPNILNAVLFAMNDSRIQAQVSFFVVLFVSCFELYLFRSYWVLFGLKNKKNRLHC